MICYLHLFLFDSRPHIKHVIMAYGVDLPTEVGYVYKKLEREDEEKDEFDGIPSLERVIWEEAHGRILEERLDTCRSLTDTLVRRKAKRGPLEHVEAKLQHSGDGTVPYLSLSWAHTWLLHAIRAQLHSQGSSQSADGSIFSTNALEDVNVSHRPKGATEWVQGAPSPEEHTTTTTVHQAVEDKRSKDVMRDDDTGTTHPHGTKYKPEMVRFSNVGKSRKTGMKYSTTVIEAIGVEHKETTRNYDILAAVFTDVLRNMHDDFGIVQ